jgi:hypothetical protein
MEVVIESVKVKVASLGEKHFRSNRNEFEPSLDECAEEEVVRIKRQTTEKSQLLKVVGQGQ